MSTTETSAGLSSPQIAPRRARLPPALLAVTLPLAIGVAIGLAGVSFINSYTELHCVRTDHAITEGDCTLRRGSLAFSYTESFYVRDLTRATVEAAGSDVAHRAQDGAAERVYVWAGGEPMRIIDNGRWTHEEREAQAARINAFVDDKSSPELSVRYDRRASLLLMAFGFALLFATPFVLRRWRAAQLTVDDLIDA